MNFNSKTFLEKFFGDKKFIKLMLYLFIPVALQSLVTISITYVDNFFIAKFANNGTEAKTALGLVSPVILIPQSILIGFLTGIGVMSAQYFGNQDNDKLKQTILLKILFGFVFGLISMTILMTATKEIINIVSLSENIITKNFATIYLFWSGISMIPLGIAFALEFSLKDTRQPIIPLLASILAMISNVIMDPLFIMDPNLTDEEKIRNIAITTAAARTIESVFILTWLFFKKNNSNYFFNCKKISLEVFKTTGKFGWQVMLNESLFGFFNAFFIIASFHYNPALEDAMTTYSLLTQFTSLMWPSTAAVCSVVVGVELGKGNLERARYNSAKTINWSLVLAAFMGTCILLSTLFINELLSPNASPDMIQLTKEIEYILVPVIFIIGPYSIIYYSLRSGGSKYLVLIDALSSFLFCSIIGLIVYIPGVKEKIPPILFVVILELDNLFRLIVAVIAYKFSNWSNNLTSNFEKINDKKINKQF